MTAISFPRFPAEQTDASLSVALRLAQELSGLPGAYRVIGGTGVHLLCREHGQLGPHIGSMDVDLILAPDAIPADQPVADRLEAAGLRPERGDRGSMYWFADVSDRVVVPVDLLAPRPTEQSPEERQVGGILAWCPPGTGAVLRSPISARRDGTAWGRGPVRGVVIQVASGAALIMAKARSFQDRAHGRGRPVDLPKAAKHAYDLFYLLTAYSAGARTLVDEWRSLAYEPLKRRTVEILAADFFGPRSLGAGLAAGVIRANVGDSPDLERLVGDQVSVFLDSVK